eukprot:CAMPEP_0184455668 /NCGR_PEP_ID=MMETSP0740-20130409/24182_1 /TAXON_ID=385413 /ORGANISM="Thalassiosira miniscula, Strain CCMP1093" /LENGTH=67 /DNA_ID=CAMNT_0026827561 /DNA_START=32 /DNA_END=235 /DNA_ORIENTATION=-
MPEYGAVGPGLIKVTCTPSTGVMPHMRNINACACPPPTNTKSRVNVVCFVIPTDRFPSASAFVAEFR